MVTRSLTGDCRDVLRTLPDDCVVTSPPLAPSTFADVDDDPGHSAAVRV
jgi:hypothetical protein